MPTIKVAALGPEQPAERHTEQHTDLKPSGPNPYGITVGQTVEHQRFGLGEVVSVEGDAESAKATIRFRNAGTKQLLLRFARLKVIET